MEAHILLKEWWSRTGVNVETWPATADAIGLLASRYKLVLPEDFHRYLRESSPKEENWDDEMGNWWPVGSIKNIPDEYEHGLPWFIPNAGRKFLFFLDHCIWCWAWAISCEEDETYGKVSLIGGHDERFVAKNFSDFVNRYTTDWISVS